MSRGGGEAAGAAAKDAAVCPATAGARQGGAHPTAPTTSVSATADDEGTAFARDAQYPFAPGGRHPFPSLMMSSIFPPPPAASLSSVPSH